MTDLQNPKWMWMKAIMFLVIGLLSGGLLLAEHFSWSTLALLLLVIWAFCRAYYFAFYVITHYIDPNYKFAGLLSAIRYCIRQRP